MSSSTHALKPGAGGAGIGEIILLDAGIIATITDDANWDGDTGDFTGVLPAGLVAGNVHYDNDFNLRYHFDGTTLRRINYNTQV